MEDNYDYDAPQWVDLCQDLYNTDDKHRFQLEQYFEIEHEDGNDDKDNDNEFYSPIARTPYTFKYNNEPANVAGSDDEDDNRSSLRRSLSTSCLPQSKKEVDATKACGRTTRAKGAPRVEFLAQPKCQIRRYVSTAEALDRYYKATPDRCRSKPANNVFVPKSAGPQRTNTIPCSPALTTKHRQRIGDLPPSREEQELREFEQAQKLQFKAHPVNGKILKPLKQKEVEKKPPTTCMPFKITAVNKDVKKAPPSPRTLQFHAKPVPKTTYEKAQPKLQAPKVTETHTPSCLRKHFEKMKLLQKQQAENKEKMQSKPFIPVRTTTQPFSFEVRDKKLIKKKEETIQKIIEEERKMASEFHAKPVPKKILESPTVKPKLIKRSISKESLKSLDKEDNFEFKARPATVLRMKAFEPKKFERPLLETAGFEMQTDRRAREREAFAQQLREKAQAEAELKIMQEEMRRRQEEEEVLKIRKETQYVAKPIRKFKQVKKFSPKKLTEPVSPKFSCKANKENINI